jgi:hypothetical protein
MNRHLLSIYLNDHLAMMEAEIAVTKRMRSSNERDASLVRLLARHAQQVREQRRHLHAFMNRLHIGRNHLKLLGARIAERLGRFKLNGRLRSYSPLSRVVELEGLSLATEARAALWNAIGTLKDGRAVRRTLPLNGMVHQTNQQKKRLERHRTQAAAAALA